MTEAETGQNFEPVEPAPEAGGRARRRRRRAGAWLLMTLALLAALLGFLALGLTGRPIQLPVWAVAEIEDRVNGDLRPSLSGAAVSIGGIEAMVDSGFVPRLRLHDIRLMRQDGATMLNLPEVQVAFDPAAAASAMVRVSSLRVIGADVTIHRAEDGSFDLTFGSGASPAINTLEAAFKAVDRTLALPALSRLKTIEAEALALTLDDRRSNQVWSVGDGRFTLENRPEAIAAELGFSLMQGAAAPARALLTLNLGKGSSSARVAATVDQVAARDLAAQATPLAWLGVLDAPISGRIAATLDPGGVTAFDGQLTIGSGALRPTPGATPINFEKAGIKLSFDPGTGQVVLQDLSVQSDSLRLLASGQVYLIDAEGEHRTGPLTGALPRAFLGQIAFLQVMVDPAGLFQAPVRFSQGALDLRLALDPFRIDIGQLSLVEQGQTLSAHGTIGADAGGWQTAMDFALDEIGVDRLLALWPVRVVPGTRNWLKTNISSGDLFNVNAALRLQPGTEPRLSLGYEYRNADVRFIRTLPPITGGYGHATIEGRTYTLVLDSGTVTPPKGGAINLLDAAFVVPDITKKPASADISMHTESSLTAALSLLDEPPFRFMTKADKPVDLGEGHAQLLTELSLPLRNGVKPGDVDYHVSGTLTNVSSAKLVPGKTVTAAALDLEATPKGLRISGPGKIGAVPFEGSYTQGFGPEAKGRARVEGIATLSQAAVDEFSLGLPQGLVSGSAPGRVVIDLVKGQPALLQLTSDLKGMGLTMPAIGWTKAKDASGALDLEARLSQPAVVTRLSLAAGGLKAAEGQVTMKPAGGLDVARFGKASLNQWFEGAVTLTGQGKGKPVAVALTSGAIDLQRMAGAGLGGGGAGAAPAAVPIAVTLDRVKVSSEIDLTGFRGDFTTLGGFNGRFSAEINGKTPVQGTVVPSPNGTAVRLQSQNAGAALKAAGVFSSARGGDLDLTLMPQAEPGTYAGKATITDVRVRNDNVLTELLNAISVVGLLDQLQGDGITFSLAEADFQLTPQAVTIFNGSAVGASLGVSLAGVFRTADKALNMQGVVSPIYMVNGIGSLLTRRGEGLIGFNYDLKGTSQNPAVSVNPLSILTPGMFREIFRQAPPQVKGPGG